MDGWSAPGVLPRGPLPLEPEFFGACPFTFAGAISATFSHVRPPSVESAMGTLPLVPLKR